MTLIRSDDIRDMHARRKTIQQRGIDAVVNRCYSKIKATLRSNSSSTSCVLEIPEFVFGYPLYDLTDCVLFAKRHLESNGYKVSYFFPRMLVASWAEAVKTALFDPASINFKKSGKAVLSLI